MLANLRKDLKQHGRTWLAAALTAVFGLQLLRVLFVSFVGYLRDSQGMASLSLAPIAIGVFALCLLAGPLNRWLGTRTVFWLAASGVAIMRLAEQFAQSAALDLYLSAAGTVLFLMYIPIAVGMARSKGGDASVQLGLGVLLGVCLDSAIQIAASTLDLSWQPGLLSLIIVALLAGAQLWALRSQAAGVKETRDGSWLSSLTLAALGPWLFLQLMVFQNTALFASLGDMQIPAAGAMLILGNVLGIWIATGVVWPSRSYLNVIFAGVFMLIPLLLAFREPAIYPGLFLTLGGAFSIALGMFIFLGAGLVQRNKGLMATTIMNGIGQILFVLLVFIYYASYDIDFGIRSGLLRPVAAALVTLLVTLAYTSKRSKEKAAAAPKSPILLAGALLLIPLVLYFSSTTPAAVPAAADAQSVRVMDYNLHDAVNADGRVDPEALARLIEDSSADIVGVQEISRGWLVWGGMDMLTWLSQRLDMPYVWAPTADAQWGIAVFSRYPIVSSEYFELPPDEVLLLRGYLVTKVDVGGQILTVINTHFSEKAGQDEIRAAQSSAILDTWNGAPLTILMGDLNSLPDSLAVTILLDAGLVDISREIGEQPTYTSTSVDPHQQIDYIFVSPDLGYRDFVILQTTASDHLPLITTITMP